MHYYVIRLASYGQESGGLKYLCGRCQQSCDEPFNELQRRKTGILRIWLLPPKQSQTIRHTAQAMATFKSIFINHTWLPMIILKNADWLKTHWSTETYVRVIRPLQLKIRPAHIFKFKIYSWEECIWICWTISEALTKKIPMQFNRCIYSSFFKLLLQVSSPSALTSRVNALTFVKRNK